MRFVRNLIGALLIGLPSLAWGQSAVLQGGAWSSGHLPMYVGQGSSQPIVQDAGPAGGGSVGMGIAELLMIARGTGTAPYAGQGSGPYGTVNCLYDGPNTGPNHYLCLSANAQGGALIAVGNGGGASAQGFNFIVNGVTYAFPFVTSGIVGPPSTTVNDAACWNNTVGTLLKDCGAFVTVGGNNTWTGTNNYTGPFQISGAVQTFPPSGNIVGTSDTQTLTNKHIAASQVDSGTLPGVVMPALSGDVTMSAGTTATSLTNGTVTNAKFAAAGAANTVKGAATSTAVTDLTMPSCSSAGNALQWTTSTGFNCATLSNQTAGWGLTGSSTFSISTSQPPYGFNVPINLGLTASVGASALTINVTGANGSAPSATNPVLVPFRSTTLATGTPVWTAITSALSITIPSAATLGTSNNVPFRTWIFLAYNGGTPEIGVATCSNSTQIFGCTAWESTRVTSTTISGFAASAGTLYATSGVSNDSVRIIGYFEYSSGLATAGAWASVPTTLQLLGPGTPKPGALVQSIYNSSTTAATTTSATFAALTNRLTQAITPTSSVNLIKVTFSGTAQVSTAGVLANLQIARGLTLIGIPRAYISGAGGTNGTPIYLYTIDAPGSTSSTTYSYQGLIAGGATLSFPPASSGVDVLLEEIEGALEPANDNGEPLRMVG